MSKKLYALTGEQAKLGREIANMVLNLVGASGESGGVARCRDVADALATPLDTDDAVERMARAILQRVYGGNVDLLGCDAWGVARGDARAALDALLEEA